jgi:hypothetical protein
LFVALVHGLPVAGVSGAPLTFYVATNGNDQWSGRREAPARDGRDGPFATLPVALKAARAARHDPAQAKRGVTILLRAGTYELVEPLTLTPEDSGASASQPFTLAAYRREKPVVSGGRRITGWKQSEGQPNLWQAEVPGVRDGQWRFRSLFVGGERKQRARAPNEGFFRIQGASPQDQPVKLKFKPGDIKKEWAEPGDVEVVALLAWADFRMFIRAVDEANSVTTLSNKPRPSNKENDARYWVENAADALDAPGEWYLDRKSGLVSYLAHPGEDLSQAEVVVPQLQDLLILKGDFERKQPVQHVVLRGLTFSFTDWDPGLDGYADTQAAVATPGDIFGEGATDCVIEDCVFAHLAGYALDFARGCQRVRLVGNEMFDLGGGGVRLGEPAKRAEPFEQNHSHTVADNHMHGLGRVYAPAVGVLILQSGTNRVAHNDIHDLYYTAISVGWNWGYQETPCRENVIEFNHLHHVGQFMLSDMGAVYTLGIQKGTVIRNNLIHDVNSFTYGGWGLYPDEGTSEIVWENNVVYRCKSAGFHQHYGRENVVRNNIFAFNREHELMRTREEAHLSFFFTNNVVYFDCGTLLGSNWKNNQFRMDYNLYFDTRLGTNAGEMKFAGATFEEWRQRGHDQHSVIADPLFVAPEDFDFRLKRGSPAAKLGFKSIDLRRVGVRPAGARH